jgi:CPA2 family monovalent cation:H+ antiporter-2
MECLVPHRPNVGAGGQPREPIPVTQLTGHAVLVGYGRVGSLVGAGLGAARWPFLVIEEKPDLADAARAHGGEAILGNAGDPRILQAANLGQARVMFVAIPQAFEAGQIVAQARAANAALKIIARAHSDAEVENLRKHGTSLIIMGEREIAQGMLNEAMRPQSAAESPELTVTPIM